jgi:hypothetical protein
MKFALAAVLLAVASPALVRGQVVSASVNGVVLDPTGAAVPKANVRAVNQSTNLEVRATTDSEGRYTFPSLPPGGPYSLTADAAGFSTEERNGISLEINQAARIDFTLQVGATSEKLVVTAEAPLVDASSAAMGQDIPAKSIVDLPLNERNTYSFVFLAPGVQGDVSFTYNNLNLSINGGRPGTSDILVDGIPSSPGLANPNQGIAVFPSVESVQELKVQTNAYSAEFGRSGSGIINMIYKSGTNQFHGSLFEFLRNSNLDANTYFANLNGTPLSNFKRNQFGGSAGGPVEIPRLYHGRNRTFFFAAYEGLRRGSATSLTTTVPTEAQRNGDFSRLLNSSGQLITIYDPTTTVAQGSGFVRQAFPQNIIPGNRIDKVGKNIAAYFPLPNRPGSIAGANNYFASGTAVLNTNILDAKVDEILNDRSRFFVRYSRLDLNQPAPVLFPAESAAGQRSPDNQAQLNNSTSIDYTRTISPTNLVEVRYGFVRIKLDYRSISLGFDPTTLGFPSYIAANADHLIFPGIAPANYYSLGAPGQGDTRNPSFESHLLAVENTLIRSAHTLRFGVEARLLRVNDTESGSSTGNFTFTNAITQGPNPNAASATAGNSIASLLLGVGSGSMGIALKDVATQSHYYAAFLQDDWKLSRKLTVNLGLRWDLDIPRTERFNRLQTFDQAVTSPLAGPAGLPNLRGGILFAGVNGVSRRQFDPQWHNLNPRFGFAYQASKNTAIRGGVGIFFAPTLRGAGATVGSTGYGATTNWAGSPDGLTPATYLSNPFPLGLNLSSGNSLGLLTGIGSSFETPMMGDNKVPYTASWSFGIQRQLPGGILVDASYVGNRGVHLNMGGEATINLNQLAPSMIGLGTKLQQSVPNPFYKIITTGPEAAANVPLAYLLTAFPQFTEVDNMFPTGGYSEYHSLQLKAQKRFGHGLTALLTFTGQKLIDDFSILSNVGNSTGGIQNIYDGRGERSVSSNDRSRRLVISGTYQLPLGRGKALGKHWNRAVDSLLGGWQINGISTYQTGFPISVTAQNTCTNCGINTLRPNNNGHSAALSGPVSQRLNRYFDPSVFSATPAFTLGNVARTLPDVRAQSAQNLDFSLFKIFRPIERMTITFRAEAFNALNQVVFGMPNTTQNSNQFGVISSQANSPRTIQFGLKLVY